MDIFLIIEKGDQTAFLGEGRVYVQKFSFRPLKALENLLIIKYARLSGYKDFYIHYSFLSAFNASLVAGLSGGRTFYWNCGLPWLYKRNFLRDKFERLVYRSVNFLVTGTEGMKKEYAKHYRLPLSKIKVMPNWIDLEKVKGQRSKVKGSEIKKKLNIPDDSKVLLFVHRLSRRKGAHYLPEIVRRLNSMIPDSSFMILVAGDGPERKSVESRIKNYELWNKVRFLGWIPQNEVLKYFVIADIFILPSEEEGFPHVLLEAMATGVPFVAFDVGGVKEVIPRDFSRYLAESSNLNFFIKKIGELLRIDSKNLEILRKSELDWVKKFDIKFAMEKFKNLF